MLFRSDQEAIDQAAKVVAEETPKVRCGTAARDPHLSFPGTQDPVGQLDVTGLDETRPRDLGGSLSVDGTEPGRGRTPDVRTCWRWLPTFGPAPSIHLTIADQGRCMGWAPVCARPVVGTARELVSGVLGYLLSDLGDHAGRGRRTYDVCAARSWRPVAFWPVRLAANRREARSPWPRRR